MDTFTSKLIQRIFRRFFSVAIFPSFIVGLTYLGYRASKFMYSKTDPDSIPAVLEGLSLDRVKNISSDCL